MKAGWVVRRAYVAECGNCGDWSRAYVSADAAVEAEDMKEIDGVALCLSCAESVEQEQDAYARSFEPLGPEPCGHPKDALGHCLGSCQGEGWDR